MRSGRVPVLRLGSRGTGGDARSLRLRSQASASVCGGSDMPVGRKSLRNAELSSLFTFRITKVSTGHRDLGGRGRETQNCRHFWTRVFASQKCQQVTGIRGVVVAKRRTVVTFGLVLGLCISKVSTVTGIRKGRGCETQNCRHFWTPRVFASQKCQRSQGSGGVVVAKRRTVVTFGRLGSSRLKSVNGHREPGGRGCETQNCRHFWTRR